MRTSSWADAVAENDAVNGGNNVTGITSSRPGPGRSTYVPPHLRNNPAPSSIPAPSPAFPASTAYPAPSPNRNPWIHPNPNLSRGGGGTGVGGGVNYHNRGTGGGGGGVIYNRREREVNPFDNDETNAAESSQSAAVFEQENSGINFDAYEDIPVETSGENVPPAGEYVCGD